MTVFLNTTDKNGLINICESLCLLGDGAISGNTLLLKQFTNYINIGIAEVRHHIMKVDKTWKSDDYNYTNLPEAPITFVLEQYDYEVPVASNGANVATLLRINHIYYVKSGQRIYLTPMLGRERVNVGDTVTGTPTAYYFDGKSIWFDMAPSQETIDDIQEFYVDFSRLDDPFVSGDTTQQPGFLATYHHILAYKAVALHRLPENINLALTYSSGDIKRPGMFEAGILELMSGYASMNGDMPKRMTPHVESSE